MKFMLYAATRSAQLPSTLLCCMTNNKYYLIKCRYQVQKKIVYKYSLERHTCMLKLAKNYRLTWAIIRYFDARKITR